MFAEHTHLSLWQQAQHDRLHKCLARWNMMSEWDFAENYAWVTHMLIFIYQPSESYSARGQLDIVELGSPYIDHSHTTGSFIRPNTQQEYFGQKQISLLISLTHYWVGDEIQTDVDVYLSGDRHHDTRYFQHAFLVRIALVLGRVTSDTIHCVLTASSPEIWPCDETGWSTLCQ